MQVIGIDFTSAPSRRKPITALYCTLDDKKLKAENLEEWRDFSGFENALRRPGPWIMGIDFPFGQARCFIEMIGWPVAWSDYVRHSAQLGRMGFRDALNSYRAGRRVGDKEHRRATDDAAGSISPQKIFGVPVGLMFFEGAHRLMEAGVTIPHIHQGDPKRIVVEAYPGIAARTLVGRLSYKTDTRKKQTSDQSKARHQIFDALLTQSPRHFGFYIDASESLCDDPCADQLDALLCAAQAAWAWQRRNDRFGAPMLIDPLEGWIADPKIAEAMDRPR